MILTSTQIQELAATDLAVDEHGTGFDYLRQAWVENGRYLRCGHPETMECSCYGRAHAGEEAF